MPVRVQPRASLEEPVARDTDHWAPMGDHPRQLAALSAVGDQRQGRVTYNNSDPRCGLERALLVMWFLWRQGERGKGQEREGGKAEEGREEEREKKREYIQML